MSQISHSFIVDGDEVAGLLPVALDKAIDDMREKSGLTIKISDVTIERNPHGNGMWQYTVKVRT